MIVLILEFVLPISFLVFPHSLLIALRTDVYIRNYYHKEGFFKYRSLFVLSFHDFLVSFPISNKLFLLYASCVLGLRSLCFLIFDYL